MILTYLSALLLWQCTGGYCDLLRGIEVPLYAFAGGQATLSCTYDLRATRLYSLKWYHNNTEFYRYVPTERNRPINIKPSHKFSVMEEFRNDARVTITLAQLRVSASGQYRCEVIAEHPSFRTEAKSATMTVLREALTPPVLVGAREIYEPTEVISIRCQPRRPFHPDHRPTLQWFLEGNQVESEWVTTDPGAFSQEHSGISLHVPGEQVVAAGGNLQAECRLSLGSHHLSAYKTLRVRVRMISYVDNYHSSGPGNSPAATFCVYLLAAAASSAASLMGRL